MAQSGQHQLKKPALSDLEAFAIFLLVTAEDNEFIAISLLLSVFALKPYNVTFYVIFMVTNMKKFWDIAISTIILFIWWDLNLSIILLFVLFNFSQGLHQGRLSINFCRT
jgi:hypothetical protein